MAGAEPKPLPHQLVWQARQIAAGHNLYIIEVNHKGKRAWVVYRQGQHGARGMRIFRTTDPDVLLERTRTTAGIAA